MDAAQDRSKLIIKSANNRLRCPASVLQARRPSSSDGAAASSLRSAEAGFDGASGSRRVRSQTDERGECGVASGRISQPPRIIPTTPHSASAGAAEGTAMPHCPGRKNNHRLIGQPLFAEVLPPLCKKRLEIRLRPVVTFPQARRPCGLSRGTRRCWEGAEPIRAPARVRHAVRRHHGRQSH